MFGTQESPANGIIDIALPLSPANVCERLLRHGFTRVEQREAVRVTTI